VSRKALITIEGTEAIKKVLAEIAPRHARNLLRATIDGVAQQLVKKVKPGAPVKSGNLKQAIKAKREKAHPDRPTSILRAKGAFYWRFQDEGTKTMPTPKARDFVTTHRDHTMENYEQIIITQFKQKLKKAVKRELKNARR
jgi:HK97 gp10 family phage protein